MDELKCPWCGGPAEVVEVEGQYPEFAWVCNSMTCDASGPWRPTRDEAVGTRGDVFTDQSLMRHTCSEAQARADAAEAKLKASEEWCAKIALGVYNVTGEHDAPLPHDAFSGW